MLAVSLNNGRISLLAIVLTGLLSSCTAIDIEMEFVDDPELIARVITQQADAFPEIDPLYIDDEIKKLIDSRIQPNLRSTRKVELLQEILFGEDFLDIQYSELKTQTAIEAYEARVGNCLSVMNLYVAMARYAGVDANFQTVKVRPLWDRRGGLLVLNQHINATGRTSLRDSYVMDFTPDVALQQLTAQIVSDTYARALYFSNLGVEEMVQGNFSEALVFLKNALWINPRLSIGWNNIGTAYNRLGDRDLAEYSYQMAFTTDTTNASAINNLARFYIAKGDAEKATAYRRAVTRFNTQNPYYHFDTGNFAFRNGELQKAINSYQRAIRLKDVEPDFYLALANVYRFMGEDRQANRMTARADELLSQTEIYQPGDEKVRFIEATGIRRGGAGLTIFPNGRN